MIFAFEDFHGYFRKGEGADGWGHRAGTVKVGLDRVRGVVVEVGRWGSEYFG